MGRLLRLGRVHRAHAGLELTSSSVSPSSAYHHDHHPRQYCAKSQMVLDSRGWEIEFFPHIPPLFMALKESEVKLALASRTEEPAWAEEVVHLFKVDGDSVIVDFTHAREIYPTSKEKHFRELSAKLGVPLEKMLFFDDERRNIHDVRGVRVEWG